jgi:endonuclease V-like protein UPF0215 family
LPLHLEKKAIRALGLAESFSQRDIFSTLAGVVMRSDLIVDGFAINKLQVSGSDATERIVALFENLDRNDLNAILLSGSVLSLYNIVDVDALNKELALPVIALTFKKSRSDLGKNIKAKFAKAEAKQKILLLQKLGKPKKIDLNTGYPVFVRPAGATLEDATKILNKFTLQGAVPEPIRLARLLARSVAYSLAIRKD